MSYLEDILHPLVLISWKKHATNYQLKSNRLCMYIVKVLYPWLASSIKMSYLVLTDITITGIFPISPTKFTWNISTVYYFASFWCSLVLHWVPEIVFHFPIINRQTLRNTSGFWSKFNMLYYHIYKLLNSICVLLF